MISYEPLFKTMEKKGFTTYKLFQEGFPNPTYYRMKHGNSVSTNTIEHLCKILDCRVEDVMEFIPDK